MTARAFLIASIGAMVATVPRSALADANDECIAAAEQGQALRAQNKYGKAHASFVTCARDVCPTVVAKLCGQWLREIDETTPTVVLGAKDVAGNDVTDVRVAIDGEPLAGRLDGAPVPVDPGEHVLRFERNGSAPDEQRLAFRVGEKDRRITATLRTLAPAPRVETPMPIAPPSASLFTARNVTALSLLVGGAAAIGGGFYAGTRSRHQADTAVSIRSGLAPGACAPGMTSSACQSLSDAVDAQNSDATLEKILVVAGGVLAAGAVVTWLAWPTVRPEASSAAWLVPTLAPGRVGLGVGGRF